MMDCIGNRFFAVTDLDIFSIRLTDADLNIVNDILWLFKSRVIGCDDRQICQSARDLSHLITAGFCTVSSTAKQANQSMRMIFS